jgi:hypothetical protein
LPKILLNKKVSSKKLRKSYQEKSLRPRRKREKTRKETDFLPETVMLQAKPSLQTK